MRTVDLLFFMGQSNMAGRGEAALGAGHAHHRHTGLGGAGIDEGRHHRPRFHARFIHTSGVVLFTKPTLSAFCTALCRTQARKPAF